MVKRTVVCILSVLMLFLSMGFTFSDTDNLKGPKENGDITIQYQSISKIETNLSFIGAYATPLIRVTPINYVEVDQVVLDVKLMKVGDSAIVKRWNETVDINSMGTFIWSDSYKVASRGTYYFNVIIKTYCEGSLLETVTKDSAKVVY